jgi:cardiolipin synthase
MEDLFLHDLQNATEVVLRRNRVRAPGGRGRRHGSATSGGGSRGRVAAGAVRVGNTVAAAVANTRVLDPVEANIALFAGLLLAAIAALAFIYPRGIAYPLGVVVAWLAAAILYRGIELFREARKHRRRDAPLDKTTESSWP